MKRVGRWKQKRYEKEKLNVIWRSVSTFPDTLQLEEFKIWFPLCFVISVVNLAGSATFDSSQSEPMWQRRLRAQSDRMRLILAQRFPAVFNRSPNSFVTSTAEPSNLKVRNLASHLILPISICPLCLSAGPDSFCPSPVIQLNAPRCRTPCFRARLKRRRVCARTR